METNPKILRSLYFLTLDEENGGFRGKLNIWRNGVKLHKILLLLLLLLIIIILLDLMANDLLVINE